MTFSTCIRYFFSVLTYTAVGLVVLAAILLSVARLLLPVIEDYKPDIESWVSGLVGQQIEIATLDAAWYGLEPQLVLKGVRLLSKDGSESVGYFQQARIGFNIVGSLLEGRFKPGAFTIEGANIALVRQIDGSISIIGVESGVPNRPGSENQAISDWLFNQRLLDVKDTELHWLDLQNGGTTWHFSKVNLRFRNDGDHHLIHGSVSLPEELGARLEVAMDVRGELLSAKGWTGSAYLEGANLQLDRWLKGESIAKASVSNAMFGFKLWGQWRKAELSSIKGAVYSNGLQLSVEGKPKLQVIESLSTNFVAQKVNDAWEATLDEISISTAQTVWPVARIDAKFNLQAGMVDANVSYINVHDVLAITDLFLPEDSKAVTLLSKLKPEGILNNVRLSVDGLFNKTDSGIGGDIDSEKTPNVYISGGFEGVNNFPWKKIPGVKNLKGSFELNNKHFMLDIPRQDFRLNYSGAFSYPADLENISVVIFGRQDSQGFSLAANVEHVEYRGAASHGSLKLHIPSKTDKKDSAGPMLDLAFYFKNGLVENAKYYIPSKLMQPSAVDWITKSLISGDVKSGGLLYYGEIKEFPFYKKEGLFDLVLEIENGELIFAKSWPKISKINGEFSLFANGLKFHGHSARSLKNNLKNVNVVFPLFRTKNRKLVITGAVVGKSEDKLNYLHQSPLESIFAKNISPLKLIGKSELELKLDIPLADVTKTKASGVIHIRNNHLKAKEWKLDIKNVSTDLRFDNRGIYAKNISGKMQGADITGHIDTRDIDDLNRSIFISGAANVNAKSVGALLGNFIDKAHWARYMQGEAELKTALTIPIVSSEKEAPSKITLALDANLDNLSLSLPYPLSKKTGIKDEFKLLAELSGEKRNLHLSTSKLDALFEMAQAGESQVVLRGGIAFGKSAELPIENGYRFLGHLNYFSWSEWEPVISPKENEKPLLSSDGASGSQYFNVDVDRFEIFGLWFGKTAIQASSSAQLWSIHLSGDEVAGEIFIPVVLSSAPLVMDMDKLIITLPDEVEATKQTVESEAKNETESTYLDPRMLPEMKVKSKLFVYNKRDFGVLNMIVKKAKSGLHLDQFSMKTKYTTISATGDWLEEDDKQVSKFNVAIKTVDLGKTIKSWGIADAFGDGVGDIRVNAQWQGKPTDFSLESVAGNMDVDIQDTSLLNFELGAAKMAGLFLPRRLLLDFRDVFNKGMHFDLIKGRYTIKNGNAFTKNFQLDGPTADILMAGRIGLVAEDYDQLVTVNRRLVGDSISTLAALAANPLVNPLLAVQVYALKKLFEKQIDEILTVRYSITGSWEDPKMTPVVKNLEDRGELPEGLFD